MVGSKLLGQLGQFGGGGAGGKLGATGGGGVALFSGKEGSGTERSNYTNTGKDNQADKSFVSNSGGGGTAGGNHGAVGGIGGMGSGGLDSSLMNNILSTPSSEKSQGRTSAISPDNN